MSWTEINGIVIGISSVADRGSTNRVSSVSVQGHGCSRSLGR